MGLGWGRAGLGWGGAGQGRSGWVGSTVDFRLLAHSEKTNIQTDQSNASYTKSSLSMANLIGQLVFFFFHDGTSKLKLTV